LVQDQFTPCGDHAGKWETSLLMHLDPGMQDLTPLQQTDYLPIGASNNGILESTAEWGERATDAITEVVDARLRHLLAHQDRYQGHGAPM